LEHKPPVLRLSDPIRLLLEQLDTLNFFKYPSYSASTSQNFCMVIVERIAFKTSKRDKMKAEIIV